MSELPLIISYDSIALGKLRFWIHMQDAVYSLQQFGKNQLLTRRESLINTSGSFLLNLMNVI